MIRRRAPSAPGPDGHRQGGQGNRARTGRRDPEIRIDWRLWTRIGVMEWVRRPRRAGAVRRLAKAPTARSAPRCAGIPASRLPLEAALFRGPRQTGAVVEAAQAPAFAAATAANSGFARLLREPAEEVVLVFEPVPSAAARAWRSSSTTTSSPNNVCIAMHLWTVGARPSDAAPTG